MDNNQLVQPASLQDQDDLIEQIISMSLESEGKVLERDVVINSVQFLIANPRLGVYYKHLCRSQEPDNSEGSLFVTYEWNLYDPHFVCWIQSVEQLNYNPICRRSNVFTRLFKSVEEMAYNQKSLIKLYVETENELAINVYNRMEMIRTHEVMYEDDFLFRPFHKELKDDITLSSQIATIEDVKVIEKFLKASESLQLLELPNEDLESRIEKVLLQTQQEGCFILTKQNDQIRSMFSYFTEFSDWRFGLTLFIYDIRIDREYAQNREYHSLLIQHVMKFVKDVQLSLKVKCIRFMFKPNSYLDEIFESIGLPKAHYYVYEKKQ